MYYYERNPSIFNVLDASKLEGEASALLGEYEEERCLGCGRKLDGHVVFITDQRCHTWAAHYDCVVTDSYDQWREVFERNWIDPLLAKVAKDAKEIYERSKAKGGE